MIKINLLKEKKFISRKDRNIKVNINNFTFIVTQNDLIDYFLTFLLAYKNLNSLNKHSSLLISANSRLFQYDIFYNYEEQTITFKNSIFTFAISLKDFIYLIRFIKKEINNLIYFQDYLIDNFDIAFLYACRNQLIFLNAIKIEKIKISDLRGIINSKYGSKENKLSYVTIEQVPAYKYLLGKKEEFMSYKQHNYPGITNEQRIFNIVDSIKTYGYPLKNSYIIVFNDKNFIRDGLHRAAALAYLYGLDYEIPIMRFVFSE
jgi:hypothetical protein